MKKIIITSALALWLIGCSGKPDATSNQTSDSNAPTQTVSAQDPITDDLAKLVTYDKLMKSTLKKMDVDIGVFKSSSDSQMDQASTSIINDIDATPPGALNPPTLTNPTANQLLKDSADNLKQSFSYERLGLEEVRMAAKDDKDDTDIDKATSNFDNSDQSMRNAGTDLAKAYLVFGITPNQRDLENGGLK